MNKKLKVGIIGAGFAGLSAAYSLAKEDCDITIFESGKKPGGLAVGFRHDKWDWSLEHHYHHLFTSDNHIIDLAAQVHHPIIFKRPITSTLYKKKIYQLDSPIHVLLFKPLLFVDRLRLAVNLLFLRLFPFWQILEKFTTQKYLLLMMGKNTWEVLWKPLMVKKFGRYSNEVSASWFWARIKKRSARLGYPKGGFLSLAETIVKEVRKQNVRVLFKSSVSKIENKNDKVRVVVKGGKSYLFDKVICTLPTPFFFSVAEGLDQDYKDKYKGLKGLGAINLVLILKEPFFTSGTYWLNINNIKMNFLAVVEHTNLVDKKHYNNSRILYVGNYLEREHKYFTLDEKELFNEYLKDLRTVKPGFSIKDVDKMLVFKAPFAQPVIPINYSKRIPPVKTPLENVYLANIQQVYPWDRGTNYAVEIGQKVARMVIDQR